MAERRVRLDQPSEATTPWIRTPKGLDRESFGVLSEKFARFMGTPQFILWMTVFVAAWLLWNTFGPAGLQFDPRSLNYTLLTLILSLQASYAAPLILLAQNRQADPEFLTREVASLRLAMRDAATRDFVRGELRDLLEELVAEVDEREAKAARQAKRKAKARAKAKLAAKAGVTKVPGAGAADG